MCGLSCLLSEWPSIVNAFVISSLIYYSQYTGPLWKIMISKNYTQQLQHCKSVQLSDTHMVRGLMGRDSWSL